jgi:hypothetical protein
MRLKAEGHVAALRQARAMDARARAAYYDHFRCVYCGECPSIHCDEHKRGGPACTPCRAERGL